MHLDESSFPRTMGDSASDVISPLFQATKDKLYKKQRTLQIRKCHEQQTAFISGKVRECQWSSEVGIDEMHGEGVVGKWEETIETNLSVGDDLTDNSLRGLTTVCGPAVIRWQLPSQLVEVTVMAGCSVSQTTVKLGP